MLLVPRNGPLLHLSDLSVLLLDLLHVVSFQVFKLLAEPLLDVVLAGHSELLLQLDDPLSKLCRLLVILDS